MSEHKNIPYGHWESSITAEMVSLRPNSFDYIKIDGEDIYWIEERPLQGGRCVIMRLSQGIATEVTPPEYNVRSKVHEYGGLSYTVDRGVIYFVNYTDQALYSQKNGVINLIYEGKYGLAEPVMTPHGIVAVAEEHKNHDVINSLVLIDPASGELVELTSGEDFYAAPAVSPDRKKLAWLSWNHPNMPWDESKLSVANISNHTLTKVRTIAGGSGESVLQPKWSPEGVLHYISDKSGWWNIYTEEGQNICSKEAEFGEPLWVLGLSWYGFSGTDVIATFHKDGRSYLMKINKDLENQLLPFEAADISSLQVHGQDVTFIAGFSDNSNKVMSFELRTNKLKTLAGGTMDPTLRDFCSVGEPITFPSKGGRQAHAIYYAPKNPHFSAPADSLPPLIVKAHGGPTLHVTSAYKLPIQYWTSRGFAVLEVNYGGSSGYGRIYRDILNGNWGVVDHEDCEAGARYLIEKGKVDPHKIAIQGSSAGGFTTLCALAFGSVFKVGCSHYGVTDLVSLAKETHKFESHYLDGLVGTTQAQFEARSPLYHIEKLKSPVIFFQGTADKVVPLSQAKQIYSELKKRIPSCELVIYEGEGHGFRQGRNIKDALEKELAFYLARFD